MISIRISVGEAPTFSLTSKDRVFINRCVGEGRERNKNGGEGQAFVTIELNLS